MKLSMIFTALVAMVATCLFLVLFRLAGVPACYARVGEICLPEAPREGFSLSTVQVTRQIEGERYTLSFQNPSGKLYDIVVVRDDSLGTIERSAKADRPFKSVQTRLWSGAKSSTYFISGAVPGVTPTICVESLLKTRCIASGTLTRLTPYRG